MCWCIHETETLNPASCGTVHALCESEVTRCTCNQWFQKSLYPSWLTWRKTKQLGSELPAPSLSQMVLDVEEKKTWRKWAQQSKWWPQNTVLWCCKVIWRQAALHKELYANSWPVLGGRGTGCYGVLQIYFTQTSEKQKGLNVDLEADQVRGVLQVIQNLNKHDTILRIHDYVMWL